MTSMDDSQPSVTRMVELKYRHLRITSSKRRKKSLLPMKEAFGSQHGLILLMAIYLLLVDLTKRCESGEEKGNHGTRLMSLVKILQSTHSHLLQENLDLFLSRGMQQVQSPCIDTMTRVENGMLFNRRFLSQSTVFPLLLLQSQLIYQKINLSKDKQSYDL